MGSKAWWPPVRQPAVVGHGVLGRRHPIEARRLGQPGHIDEMAVFDPTVVVFRRPHRHQQIELQSRPPSPS